MSTPFTSLPSTPSRVDDGLPGTDVLHHTDVLSAVTAGPHAVPVIVGYELLDHITIETAGACGPRFDQARAPANRTGPSRPVFDTEAAGLMAGPPAYRGIQS